MKSSKSSNLSAVDQNAALAAFEPEPPVELSWVSDAEPGITRQRRGEHFTYRFPDGQTVRDEAELRRIRKLAVPPAYTDVWICTRADGHLQATGRDARGRKQYRYHADWQAQRGQTKFDRMLAFGGVLPRIRDRVQRQLGGGTDEPTRQRVLATLVRLLDTTWLRIGNDEYARQNRSYGLSTLRRDHAGVRGAELRLSFVGKSGVRHDVRVADRRVASVVRRCRDLPGQELFRYTDEAGEAHRIDSTDVNHWLGDAAGIHVTAKDFRTWHGSVKALELTLAACALPALEKGEAAGPDRAAVAEVKRRQADLPPRTARAVLEAVARRLGNTPAVCRKAYIHPRVLALGDALASDAARAELLGRRWAGIGPPLRGLNAAERRLMGLLRERRRKAVAAAADASAGPSPRRTRRPAKTTGVDAASAP